MARATTAQAALADQRVAELTASLTDLSGMTQLIAGVASQTRMLALNATIEAARAGEAGLGFAVVAAEVKTLAVSTAQSTDRIAETLTRLEAVTHAVAEALSTVSTEISGLDDASTALAGVASRQFGLVDRLDGALAGAVQNVSSLSSLAGRQERRGAERRELQAPVTLTWPGGTATGEVRDLSRTGLRCALGGAVLPVPGTEVTIEVLADTGAFSTPAVVAREIPAGQDREFGLFFTHLPDEAGAAIDAALAVAPPDLTGPGAGSGAGSGAGDANPPSGPASGPGAVEDDDLLAGIDLF